MIKPNDSPAHMLGHSGLT